MDWATVFILNYSFRDFGGLEGENAGEVEEIGFSCRECLF